MNQQIAVIDLGTNTFHLLIVEINELSFSTVYRERKFIKLAESGIQTIGEKAYQRALQAMLGFHQKLQELQINKVQAFGTAAMRTASNGPDFIKEVQERTGIQIVMIPGAREASLIHKGVKLAVPFDLENKLIMDIGGGSVEFIIANQKEVAWACSFPIGVAVLYEKFHQNDPIHADEQAALFHYLQTTLAPLQKALEKNPCQDLVGASGTFDVLEHMLVLEKPGPYHALIQVDQLGPVMQRIIHSTQNERLEMADLPPQRADLIVVALLLIDFILKLGKLQRIIVSAYAMKEGMIAELIETSPSQST